MRVASPAVSGRKVNGSHKSLKWKRWSSQFLVLDLTKIVVRFISLSDA